MTRLRAAIVDDEPLARARLVRLLRNEGDVEVVAEYADGLQAAAGLPKVAADVAFVDVRMPHVDGFGMLERLPPARRPLVVFVTAYSAHALQAFDAAAVDYLMKPVSPERLHEAVARLRLRLGGGAASACGDYPERLAVPDGQRLRMVAVAEIEYVLAQGNYLELHLDGRALLLRETMAAFAQRLDPRRFVRIHRSRLVRIDAVEQVEAWGAAQYWLRLRSGACMTSGRSYREPLRQALGISRAPHQRTGEDLHAG
ncbi:LytTR family DNA-binding domain-containing protein [Luteimonas sp. RD2P54]|uniref:LytTR family DNA-binding domain-containing protein n=1 Tax=Luteimonas endophytica TaxID=3042023 RepID=A0ABT6JB10_9GAMM|nr:LytTR family DNA-binding domain-containing protein [Luteimonas endophytica]MDH5823363.1 LytTR family DNA-binding domain-containing protein [Luteimonas endophytica]